MGLRISGLTTKAYGNLLYEAAMTLISDPRTAAASGPVADPVEKCVLLPSNAATERAAPVIITISTSSPCFWKIPKSLPTHVALWKPA